MTSRESLDRSLRMLTDALHSPNSSRFYGDETRPGPSRRAMKDTEYNPELSPTASKVPKIGKGDLLDLSISIFQNEISNICDISTTRVFNVQDSRLFSGPDVTSLYQQFKEAFQVNSGSLQVFDAVLEFIENCSALLDTCSYDRGLVDKEGNDLAWLLSERNTWRLVYGLYRDRIYSQDEDDEPNIEDYCADHVSEKDIVVNLYKLQTSVRENQIIIDWLERISSDYYKLLMLPKVAHFTDKTVAWENTLHQLQNTTVPFMSSRDMVTHLDPDAPLREKKPLHDLDIEDEDRLLDQMFFEIRCGRLDKAQELCIHCGQPWRAATLEGWRLHHDPNYRIGKRTTDTQIVPIEGNPNRDVWKLMAWKLCEDSNMDPKERALYAVYCGHLESLLPLCRSWEDLLWAYVKCLVDRQVEKEIRANAARSYESMPDKYWDFSYTLQEIFQEIKANDRAQAEAAKPERIIQELIALDRIPDLLTQMSIWAESPSKPQFLRFLAHLVIVLRVLGRNQPEEKGDDVIKAYVKSLMPSSPASLVAYYTSLLPHDDQVDLYSSYMESIQSPEKRIECLKAAEACEFNIKLITERVVSNIRSRTAQGVEDETLCKEMTQMDLAKISALDWVTYYPKQRVEAMFQANALIRSFVGLGKTDAARLAFNRIPVDSVQMILEDFHSAPEEKFPLQNLPPKVNSIIKEFLCYKVYLDAQEGFSDWFKNYHNTKPVKPPPVDETSIPEKVLYEHKMKKYSEEMERWRVKMVHQTKLVKAQLFNVLLFPDAGWLVDEDDETETRQNQLKAIRGLCIPQVVMLLHTVMYNMEDFEEAVDLICLIMDEKKPLYKYFTKVQLGDLLVKITESCQGLLSQSGDPFGNLGPEDDDDDDMEETDEPTD